jgi:anti-sigma B factor antagonist
MTHLTAPRSEPFHVEVATDGDGVRVAPVGELDLGTLPDVEERLDELLSARPRALVLDLRGLRFIDTSGLRLVLRLQARTRRDGVELALVPGSPRVQRIFEICGVLELLPFRAG